MTEGYFVQWLQHHGVASVTGGELDRYCNESNMLQNDIVATPDNQLRVTGVTPALLATLLHPPLSQSVTNADTDNDRVFNGNGDDVTPLHLIHRQTVAGETKKYAIQYWQELYDERAAIMEFCGGLTRVEAEKRAYEAIYGQ